MARRIRAHIRSNVVGYVAVFIALSGSAYAAVTLERNQVKSKHIGPGQVREPDLAANSVTSAKVADGSLLESDFGAGQLPQGPQGERGLPGPPGEDGADGQDGSPDTPQQVLDKVKQVDGTGSGLDADTVSGIPASELGTLGRSQAGGAFVCDDNDPVEGDICAVLTLDMPRAGRVLLGAQGVARALNGLDGDGTDNPGFVWGFCRFLADGASPPPEMFAESAITDQLGLDAWGMTTVTAQLPQGPHDFALECFEMDGDIDWRQIRISAVMLGNA